MAGPHIHVPFEKIARYVDFIVANRLDLEIYFNADCLDTITADSLQGLRDSLVYDPSLSFHAPFMDLSPGAVDLKVRRATIERFNQVLDMAAILAPKSVVFHSGYEKWKYALKTDLWLERSVETWGPLTERAGTLGVKIAIENVFEDEPTNLRLLMEAMGSPNFGVCFDTGHCNLFSKVPLEDWLTTLKLYMIELHLHDNNRSADSHLPIGDGTFDFVALFSAIRGNDCLCTLEAHSPQDVLKSIERFREMRAALPGS